MTLWTSFLVQLACLFYVLPYVPHILCGEEHINHVDDHTQIIRSSGCNWFLGSWVYNDSYPFYDASKCPFIRNGFNCLKNGRPDKEYLKYRWKPNDCDLPRFNGEDFLKRFKGKKIMFVGDSLSENQWQSLTCMVHAAIPQTHFNTSIKGDLYTIAWPDYDISIILCHKVFLVDLVNEEKLGRVLKIDSIEGGKLWKDVDMLIFNTWHWWLHTGDLQSWDYIQVGDKLIKDMDRLTAFEKGLTTWSKWIDSNINPTVTKVFFQGISPTHNHGEKWQKKSGTCIGETKPIKGSRYPRGLPPEVGVVKEVLSKLSKPVTLLDITTLSQLRKDGHPSIYSSSKQSDCSHWCLAGVPDTWNELLYAFVVT